MANKTVAGTDAAGKSSTNSSSTTTTSSTPSATFVSPVSKYNKLRQSELLAQQERLKSVRVDRKALAAAAGVKRKLESAGATRQQEEDDVWFADGALSASAPAVSSSRVGFSKASVPSSASLAKKQRRTSATRGSADGGISNVLKNYMKKVEAEKHQNPFGAASTSPATASSTSAAAEARRYLSYDSMAKQVLSKKGPGPSKAQIQEKKTNSKAEKMFSRAVVIPAALFGWVLYSRMCLT